MMLRKSLAMASWSGVSPYESCLWVGKYVYLVAHIRNKLVLTILGPFILRCVAK